MKVELDCIPCLVRQALEAARFATDDEEVQQQVLREVLEGLAERDMSVSPIGSAHLVHRRIRELSGVEDPYKELKARSNRIALDMLPASRRAVELAQEPLEAAVRMAIAGNIMDAGIHGTDCTRQADEAMRKSLTVPLRGSINGLAEAAANAERILYLADNAGEIVFDQLLIEQLPRERITVAVRGAPVLNDATMDDAIATGLTELVPVIDNGMDAPGTLLEHCSAEFVDAFRNADLIISKGQGNFESLSDCRGANIYFLFMAKCGLVADRVGCPLGSFVALSSAEMARS